MNFLRAETFETRLYFNEILFLRLILDTVDEVGGHIFRANFPH